MRIIDGVVKKLTKGKKQRFSDLNDWTVAAFGVTCFLIAGYDGLVLNEIVPQTVKTVNTVGLTTQGVLLGGILAAFGVKFWLFGSIAARCHSIIYDRWFC